MKASNQGFVDLHTPLGFFVIGLSFILLSILIIIGAQMAKKVAAREKEERRRLRASITPSEPR